MIGLWNILAFGGQTSSPGWLTCWFWVPYPSTLALSRCMSSSVVPDTAQTTAFCGSSCPRCEIPSSPSAFSHLASIPFSGIRKCWLFPTPSVALRGFLGLPRSPPSWRCLREAPCMGTRLSHVLNRKWHSSSPLSDPKLSWNLSWVLFYISTTILLDITL